MTEALVQMLNFNKPAEELGRADWKVHRLQHCVSQLLKGWLQVLVYDKGCRDIISPLVNVGDLRKQGFTLHMLITAKRDPIQDVPAIYFVSPSEENIRRIAKDVSQRLYAAFHINFSYTVSL